MLTAIQKGVSVIQVWEVGGEGREGGGGGGREEERLLRNDRLPIVWGFFYLFIRLFIGFGGSCCFVLLEGLSKGSHHVLITRYIL